MADILFAARIGGDETEITMEPETFVEYELVHPETNENFVTRDRDVALECYRDTWLVFEKQVSMCSPSLYTQARMTVTIQWHNNPEYREM
jgi:hypothetical protein